MDYLELARNAIKEIGRADFVNTDKLVSFSLFTIACSSLVIAEELRKMNEFGIFTKTVPPNIIRKAEE